jgi:hypothetical protein
MGETLQIQMCQACGIIPRRLKAVIITAKDASTKYWVKGLNTYVNVIFQFYIFYKLANISKILFCFVIKGVCV